jgi:hypothetical protein
MLPPPTRLCTAIVVGQSLRLFLKIFGQFAANKVWSALRMDPVDPEGERQSSARPGQLPRRGRVGGDPVVAGSGGSQRSDQQRDRGGGVQDGDVAQPGAQAVGVGPAGPETASREAWVQPCKGSRARRITCTC